MGKKQVLRSEETKRDIIGAAAKLFAERGYDAVSMREIAKEAGCSHTTIYIYFQDKEALLHRLSMSPLMQLKERMQDMLADTGRQPEDALKSISREFIDFCLRNRTMYKIFFTTKAGRVDEAEPNSEINKLRNEMFGLLMQSMKTCIRVSEEQELLKFTRIFFFTLHGIVATYNHSEEEVDAIMSRLGSTFDEAVGVLLAGIKAIK